MNAPQPTTSGTVASDIPCTGCGYNLRGLATGGLCPECAAPIGGSLESYRNLATSPQVLWARMVVVGLAAWLLLTPACLAVAMMVGVNNGNPMTIVFVNFPGPKVWAVPIIRFAVGPADGSLIYFLSVLSPLLIAGAVYLVTWPRQAHQRERLFSLRRVARVSTAVLSGGIFGVLLAMVPVNTVAQQLSMAMLAIASVELPCTIVLYLYLSNVARTMELPDEAMFLRICAIAIGAASLAALFIGLGPQRPRMLAREAPFQVLFWCYGAVTVTTAIVAYASLVRVAAAIWGIAWARPNRKIG